MNPVSSKLVPQRYISQLSWWAIVAIVFAVLGATIAPWWYVGTAITVALMAWLLWLIPQQVKLLQWQETEDEFIIARGRFFHTFTVVPYGRIQFVDVTQGPIARRFGLKTLVLNTAASSTDASLPGLEAAQADELRERLTVKARERMSGL